MWHMTSFYYKIRGENCTLPSFGDLDAEIVHDMLYILLAAIKNNGSDQGFQ